MKKILFFMATLAILGCSKEDEGGVQPPEKPAVAELPVAVDDKLSTSENTSLKFSGLLDNDTVYEYARITSIDSQTTKEGTVVDNRDGTYTYNPNQDFIGEDTFEYTMCDNASPKKCSTATVTVTVSAASVVALEDAYETEEDKVLVITNHLDNDDVPDNAVVNSVGVEGTIGSVELQNDGNIKYIPADNFAGEDSFTYTVCNDHETPICSTATIKITVIDEGDPAAVNDEVFMSYGTTSLTLSSLLKNDSVIDGAVITSAEATGTGGIVVNEDGTVTYTPEVGFSGDDTFTYTLCDDDSAEPGCSTATVTVSIIEAVSFNIPSDLQNYYSSMVFIQDPNLLFQTLADFTTTMHVNHLEYTDRHDYLYDADADPNDASMVILMYSGEKRPDDEYQLGDLSEGETFNTEHIYPQSKLNNDEAANDLHLMRVADVNVNSERLNYPFVDGSGNYKLVNGDSWFPGDDWRGDVARMVMYVNLSYGDSFDEVGSLSLFLKWNVEDPVSAFEMQRNEVIYAAQGNRNIFIDNPYIATLIWGGASAENKWE